MAKTMSPSPMTEGQIEKVVDKFRAQLRKHRDELPSEAAQIVLSQPDLGTALLAVFRKSVELISEMVVRIVNVDRSLSPQQLLNATGRRLYVNEEVVKTIPQGKGKKKQQVFFFKVGERISDNGLEKEYERRGLVPDPYALVQVNIDDPTFADDHPNGTLWRDANGHWCFVAFDRDDRGRVVRVDRVDDDWDDYWWFGGVRKSST